MEVRKDFPKRVKALAESTPREAIANLLSALMPRVPVAVRKPAPYNPAPFNPAPAKPDWAQEPDPLTKLRRGVRKPRTRRRRAGAKRYRVLRRHAYVSHKRFSWRRNMVEAAVSCDNEQGALDWLKANYPHNADKGIDFAWCAAQGYITYDLTEGE